MSEVSENSFVGFNDLFRALANKSISRTKNGKINIAGAIITKKEFDKLYLTDIKDLLSKYEETLSPEFAPTKQLYTTLDVLSSPVLSGTGVSQAVSNFYKKMKKAIKTPESKKTFEQTLTSYVKEATETPVFMLATMNSELSQKNESTIYRNLMPESSELFEGYGTKFNGDDILYLSNEGFIEQETPMYMLLYKSLYLQDSHLPSYLEPSSYEALLDFYSPSKNPNRMRNLLLNNSITPEFIELHQEMLDNVEPLQRKTYISDLIEESKENATVAEDFSKEILEYTNIKIIPDSYLENNISGEFLRKQYLEGKITISRVFEIYQTAPKYFSAVESILTSEEITTAHSKDEISDDSLMYIPKESRIAYLQQNNTKFSTMMYLFLHCDGFSVTELKQLLTENKIYDTLDFYIDYGSNPARIKELYENYLIDYQCIKNLQAAGIITDIDIQKYGFAINKEKVYQDIANTSNILIYGSANIVPFSTTGTFVGKINSTSSPENLANTYRVLGATEERIPVISHLDTHREPTFLDKYKLVPLKDSNLVALIPQDNSLPIYLMPYQEAAFILYNQRLPDNFSENESIKEIKESERLEADILKTAYQFEETQSYLTRLGYSEDIEYDKCIELMLEQYIKIKIKGEN